MIWTSRWPRIYHFFTSDHILHFCAAIISFYTDGQLGDISRQWCSYQYSTTPRDSLSWRFISFNQVILMEQAQILIQLWSKLSIIFLLSNLTSKGLLQVTFLSVSKQVTRFSPKRRLHVWRAQITTCILAEGPFPYAGLTLSISDCGVLQSLNCHPFCDHAILSQKQVLENNQWFHSFIYLCSSTYKHVTYWIRPKSLWT